MMGLDTGLYAIRTLYLSPRWTAVDLKARCCYCRHEVSATTVVGLRGALVLHLIDAHRVQAIFSDKKQRTTLSAERDRVRREAGRRS